MSVGNINAISDWINSKYSLSNKEKAMMTYFTKYTITFSGASNEIITVVNSALSLDYGYVQLDSNGLAQREMYFLPGDVVTFNGSQSNYIKEYTFGFDTNPLIRVMPDGAIFWYGNQCTDMTGGWSLKGLQDQSSGNNTVDFNNRKVNILQNDVGHTVLTTNNKIDLSNYNKIFIHTNEIAVPGRTAVYSSEYLDNIIDDYYSVSGRSGKSFYPMVKIEGYTNAYNQKTSTTANDYWNTLTNNISQEYFINPNALTVVNVMFLLTMTSKAYYDVFTVKMDQIVLKYEEE